MVQSYDFFSFPPNLSTCFSFFYSVFYFYRYVAQVAALVLGTCCPPCDPLLPVPCSPAPHRVFIEGPSDGHCRNFWRNHLEHKKYCRKQKSPLPDERQWGNMKSSNIVYLIITVSPRVKVRSSMRTSPPGFFEFMITMQYVPSDGMTNSCSTSVHSVFEILLM